MATLSKVDNIQFVKGNFNDTLEAVLNNMTKVDLAFVDGNHRYQATIDYTKQILRQAHEKTAIIVDTLKSPSILKLFLRNLSLGKSLFKIRD